jgi:uncharacterized membrane protein
MVMVGMKYFSPMVIESKFFARSAAFVQTHLKRIVIPIYILSLALFGVGFYLSGIHRILIFVGLSLAIVGHHLSKLTLTQKYDSRELSIEVVSLGIGIMVVQIMMWHYGSDLFAPF